MKKQIIKIIGLSSFLLIVIYPALLAANKALAYSCPTATPNYYLNTTNNTCERYLGNAIDLSPDQLPTSVVGDNAGNIYITNRSNLTTGKASLTIIPAGGGSQSHTAFPITASFPYGNFLDKNNNLYVANYTSNTVTKFPVGGGLPIDTPLPSGSNTPYNITGDKVGNIFVIENISNTLTVFPAGGGSAYNIAMPSGASGPTGVAVDSLGNVYVTLDTTNNIAKFAVGTYLPTLISLTASTSGPRGVVIDSGDNIYVENFYSNEVIKLGPGGTNPQAFPIPPSANNPKYMGVDNNGNVIVAVAGNARVAKISTTGGPSYAIDLPDSTSLSRGVYVLPNGNFYSTDYSANTLGVFTKNVIPANPSVNMSVLSTINPSAFGTKITLNVNLTGDGGINPTGTVQLYEGANLLSNQVVNNKMVKFNLTNLSIGNHQYTLNYSGNSQLSTISSNFTQSVVPNTTYPNNGIGNTVGGTNFTISTVGSDSLTQASQTAVGNDINWVIKYLNNGPNSNQAIIYFPISNSQVFRLGSIEIPASWSIAYSTNSNCTPGSFTYSASNSNGTDPNIKCLSFTSLDVLPPPTNSSLSVKLQTSYTTLGSSISLAGGDVFKPIVFQNKVFGLIHHSYSDVPYNQFSLECFDFITATTCQSATPGIAYPLKLGMVGTPQPLGVNISFNGTATIVGNKMYFGYGDSNGDGIMCWDMLNDTYCSGGGLNVRGEIQLNNIPWRQSEGYSAGGITGAQGVIFDIAYNPSLNEVYTLEATNHILCYNLNTGAACSGQPYSTGTTTGAGSFGPNGGQLMIVGNSLYSTISSYAPAPIGCLDMTNKTTCNNWTNSKSIDNSAKYISPFTIGNQPCFGSTINNASGLKIYCYEPTSDSFIQHFKNLDSHISDAWQLGNQNIPNNNIYFTGWNMQNIYCYDKTTEQVCSGWENGIPLPVTETQSYSAFYAAGCMFISANSGRIYLMDPKSGGLCFPAITLAQSKSFISFDPSSYFCSNASNISWDKLTYYDTGTTPNPTSVIADIYDTANCTFSGNDSAAVCTGTPIKSGNLTSGSPKYFDISDIAYAPHSRLTAVVSYNYPSIPSPAPLLSIALKPNNTPQICLKTNSIAAGNNCSNPVIISSGATNTNNTGFACITSLGLTRTGDSIWTNIIAGLTCALLGFGLLAKLVRQINHAKKYTV